MTPEEQVLSKKIDSWIHESDEKISLWRKMMRYCRSSEATSGEKIQRAAFLKEASVVAARSALPFVGFFGWKFFFGNIWGTTILNVSDYCGTS